MNLKVGTQGVIKGLREYRWKVDGSDLCSSIRTNPSDLTSGSDPMLFRILWISPTSHFRHWYLCPHFYEMPQNINIPTNTERHRSKTIYRVCRVSLGCIFLKTFKVCWETCFIDDSDASLIISYDHSSGQLMPGSRSGKFQKVYPVFLLSISSCVCIKDTCWSWLKTNIKIIGCRLCL